MQWPDTVVASQVYDWKPTLTDMIEKIQAGEMGGTVYTLTLENEGQIFAYGSGRNSRRSASRRGRSESTASSRATSTSSRSLEEEALPKRPKLLARNNLTA